MLVRFLMECCAAKVVCADVDVRALIGARKNTFLLRPFSRAMQINIWLARRRLAQIEILVVRKIAGKVFCHARLN